MSNLMMWSAIVGFLLPPVQAFLQQSNWPPYVRAIVNFLACVVAAIVTVYIQQEDVGFKDWLKSALTIIVTAIAMYHGLWKPTGVAPEIEKATTLKKA